mmetsp:Transcript_70703/g.218315  ORF Transcript_70703/g.218315 Transcript_70703/m.218315 type:complete len:307 (-) Transcript_70703:205-1125(-)
MQSEGLRVRAEEAGPAGIPNRSPALNALLPLLLTAVPLGHGEHLESERSLGNYVQKGKTNGVQLGVLDDAQPLVGEAPPDGEGEPSERHNEEELQVAVWQAAPDPPPYDVEQGQVGDLQKSQVELDGTGGNGHPEPRGRLQIPAHVPRPEELLHAAVEELSPHDRGRVPRQQHRRGYHVGEAALKVVAWDHRGDEDDELRLHWRTCQGVAQVTEAIHIVDVQPALHSEHANDDLQHAYSLVCPSAEGEAPLQGKLLHLLPVRYLAVQRAVEAGKLGLQEGGGGLPWVVKPPLAGDEQQQIGEGQGH